MNTGLKVAAVAGLTGIFWWMRSRLPKIKVVKIIPEDSGIIYHPVGVEYEMSVNGYNIRDTFYQGDQRQTVPSGDGEHFFVSDPTDTGVTLSIIKSNGAGGWDLVATGYMAFDYSGDDLPVRLAAPGVGLTLFEIAI